MKTKSLKFVLTAVMTAAALQARAADYSPGGFYIGLNGGATGANATVTPVSGTSASFDIGMNGGSGGVHVGYLSRSGGFGIGIEAELASMGVSGDETTQVGGSRTKTELSLDNGARVRARIGGGGRRSFFYGAAGWSQARSKMTLTSLSTPGQTASASDTLTGFNFGGGAEYAFTNRLIGRLEGIWDIYGGTTYKTSSNPFFADRRLDDLGAFTLRAALSFNF